MSPPKNTNGYLNEYEEDIFIQIQMDISINMRIGGYFYEDEYLENNNNINKVASIY